MRRGNGDGKEGRKGGKNSPHIQKDVTVFYRYPHHGIRKVCKTNISLQAATTIVSQSVPGSVLEQACLLIVLLQFMHIKIL